MAEFTEITFNCKKEKHKSICDIDIFCPKCTIFYQPNAKVYFIFFPIVITAIYYFDNLVHTTREHFTIELLFWLFLAVILFYIGSILRYRNTERVLCFGIIIPVALIEASRKGVAGNPMPGNDIITVFSLAVMLIVYCKALYHVYRDSRRRLNGVAPFAVLVAILNILAIVIYVILDLFSQIKIVADVQKAISLPEWLFALRVYSGGILFLVLFVYAIIKAIDTPIPPRVITRKKFLFLDDESSLNKLIKNIANILIDILLVVESAVYILRRRGVVFIKEFLRIIFDFCISIYLLLLRSLRFGLILSLSVLIVYVLMVESGAVYELWTSKSFWGFNVDGWLDFGLGFSEIIVFVFLFALIVYKKWDSLLLNNILSAFVGTSQEIKLASESILFSLIFFFVYFWINLFIAWCYINLFEFRHFPQTIGILFCTTFFAGILLAYLILKNKFDIRDIRTLFRRNTK